MNGTLVQFSSIPSPRNCIDLHAYDLERNKWQMVTPTAGALPTARHSHSAVVYQDSMYIFGGKDMRTIIVLEDLSLNDRL